MTNEMRTSAEDPVWEQRNWHTHGDKNKQVLQARQWGVKRLMGQKNPNIVKCIAVR